MKRTENVASVEEGKKLLTCILEMRRDDMCEKTASSSLQLTGSGHLPQTCFEKSANSSKSSFICLTSTSKDVFNHKYYK